MRLHRRQVEDARADVHLGDLDPLRKDVVQLEQRALEAVDDPLDLGQRDEGQAVAVQDRAPLVGDDTLARVGDDGLVLDRVDPLRPVPVLEQRPDHAVELPRLRRARGKVLGPREVELEEQLAVPRQDGLVAGEPHEAPVVGERPSGEWSAGPPRRSPVCTSPRPGPAPGRESTRVASSMRPRRAVTGARASLGRRLAWLRAGGGRPRIAGAAATGPGRGWRRPPAPQRATSSRSARSVRRCSEGFPPRSRR